MSSVCCLPTNKMSFAFRCYRNLKSNLGALDAIVECNELAVREFVAYAKDSKDPGAFISQLSTRHAIRVNHVDLEHFRVRAAQLYILSVYQQTEDFLERFRDEHPGSDTWKYIEGDSLLVSILKNVGGGFNSNRAFVERFRLEVFDYYRISRNRFMHTEVNDKRLENQLTTVAAFSAEIQSIYGIRNAPNSFDRLSFDDFLLFSRVTKDIAYKLCQLGRPNDQELAKMIMELDRKREPGVNLRGAKRRANNPTRLRNSLSGLVCSLYGLGPDESNSVVDVLLARIQEGPLA
jgi:hypothetical protein